MNAPLFSDRLSNQLTDNQLAGVEVAANSPVTPKSKATVQPNKTGRSVLLAIVSISLALVGIMSSSTALSCLCFTPVPSRMWLALFVVVAVIACRIGLACIEPVRYEARSRILRSVRSWVQSLDLVSHMVIVIVAMQVLLAYHDMFFALKGGVNPLTDLRFWTDTAVVSLLAMAAVCSATSWTIQAIQSGPKAARVAS